MPTVTVACKLPHGLVLRLFAMEDHDEPVMGGGTKTVKRAIAIGDPVTIHGVATPFGQVPKAPIVGGFALTAGVDAEFFAAWLKQNAKSAVVRNGLIFGHEKPETAQKKAAEMADLRSGLEPLVPDKDPRIPRRIETADEQKAKIEKTKIAA
jgi:hypothetical protein